MKVFIDSNVFIYGLLSPKQCNSKIILSLVEARQFEVVVSDLVLREVWKTVEKMLDKRRGYNAAEYIRQTTKIVLLEEVKKEMKIYAGKIADKDLENLAVAKHEEVDFIISFDRHYEKFDEYRTPKKFLEMLKIKTFGTEY